LTTGFGLAAAPSGGSAETCGRFGVIMGPVPGCATSTRMTVTGTYP
jgi:hypothetical protein